MKDFMDYKEIRKDIIKMSLMTSVSQGSKSNPVSQNIKRVCEVKKKELADDFLKINGISIY
jgi:hypothetical protein